MPKSPNRDFTAFRMNWPTAEYARLQAHANRIVKPMAPLIRDAVAEYLDRREESGAATSERAGGPAGRPAGGMA
jgi:hypothetical protein